MSIVEQRDIFSFSSSAAVRNTIKNKTSVNDDRIKINRLDIYHENRNELNAWLIQMKIYFEFNDISKKKILFAITYLRKRAQHWMQFKLIEYLNHSQKNENDIFDNYEFFEKKFKKIFGISNEKQTTKRIIQHIIQKSSTSNYVVKV